MTIIATLERHIVFPGITPINLYRFSAPSVAAVTTVTDVKFVLHSPAKIENIRVSCSSRNYNLSLLLEPGLVPPTIEEVYRAINLNTTEFEDNVEIWWAKPTGADQHAIFGVVQNNDNIPTGVIHFEFVLVNY